MWHLPNRLPNPRDQWGIVHLEFIVVLPVILLLLFGIVEFSRAWHNLNILTTAAREGARVGTVTPTAPGDVFDASAAVARIDQILDAANLLTGAIRTVTCDTPCVSDSEVRANVEVTFATAVPFVLPMLKELTIRQTAIMRYE